jgi:hypothetical protein
MDTTDLIFTTVLLLMGEKDKDWYMYEIDEDRIPLIDYLHRN